MQYFTIQDFTAGDDAGSVSSITGTDTAGTVWGFVKYSDGATLPSWGARAKQLTADEAATARQSSVYLGTVSGDAYAAEADRFAREVTTLYVDGQNGLDVAIQIRGLQLLSLAAQASTEGFVPLMRHILATTPETPGAGYTAAAKAALLAQIDLWLCKFPGKTAAQSGIPGEPNGPAPQMRSLAGGETLEAGRAYLAPDTLAGPISVTLPTWEQQSTNVATPIELLNTSNDDVTIAIDSGDTGISFTGGGSSLAIAGGTAVRLKTAAGLWVAQFN